MPSIFDSLINDPDDQEQSKAMIDALRRQDAISTVALGMGRQPTMALGQSMQRGVQQSFGEAMQARERAKQMKMQQAQMQAEAAQRGQSQKNWEANYKENQRQFEEQSKREKYGVAVDPITGTMRMYNGTTGEWKDSEGGTAPQQSVFNVNVTGKPTTQMSSDLLKLRQQRGAIEGAMRAATANPQAFGFVQGAGDQFGGQLGSAMANWVRNPQDSAARAGVLNNVSTIINDRAGSAQSEQELGRLRGFLPSETDDVPKIIGKFNAFLDYLDEKEAATRGFTTGELGMKPRVGAPAPQQQKPGVGAGTVTAPPAGAPGVSAPRPGDAFLPPR
jgi:hypothetical protein